MSLELFEGRDSLFVSLFRRPLLEIVLTISFFVHWKDFPLKLFYPNVSLLLHFVFVCLF